MKTISRKCALFKSMEYGFESLGFEALDGSDGYVRLTKYVDVEFTEIDNSERVAHELKEIEKQEKATEFAYQAKMANLDRMKKELLALTYQEIPNEA